MSDRQLTALAKRDPVLRPVFWGVYPEDQLPPLQQTAGRQTHRAMIVNKTRVTRKRRRTKHQKGGIFPLLALALPALTAVGKAAALGGVSAAAGDGIKKALNKRR